MWSHDTGASFLLFGHADLRQPGAVGVCSCSRCTNAKHEQPHKRAMRSIYATILDQCRASLDELRANSVSATGTNG